MNEYILEIPLLKILYSNSDEDSENFILSIYEQESRDSGKIDIDMDFFTIHEQVWFGRASGTGRGSGGEGWKSRKCKVTDAD
jgi:hypothetical protein